MITPIHILTVVTLIVALGVLHLEPVSAEITINGDTIHVETNNYKVQFDRGVITQLDKK